LPAPERGAGRGVAGGYAARAGAEHHAAPVPEPALAASTMSAMEPVRELTPAETASAWPAMRELRPEIGSEEAFVDLVDCVLRGQGYRLAGAYEPELDTPLAVAGFRLGHNLAWGRFLYVDDLVTRADARGRGHGAQLLAWLKDEAIRLGCGQLHLDSGVQRTDAHRFYVREGMTFTSHHYACGLG
jgi:GNAT superfamily N-acetyltransferase